jgi:glutathione synthase/RimK-type ligase-like ATP-grasp enzyme
MTNDARSRVALVAAGDRAQRETMTAVNSRLAPIAAAFADAGLAAELAIYDDAFADDVRDQLLAVDAVLVWVNPVTGSSDRTVLDAVLRDVASHGVLVSAHPDVIVQMGTKQVLYDTRDLGWGSDTYLYRTFEQFADEFPARLASSGPLVVKQYRGHSGIGVSKVERLAGTPQPTVRILRARVRDAEAEEIPLEAFLASCEKYFRYQNGTGRLIDQPFQPRITEGMIRCYFVRREVVGFSRQYPPAATAGTPRAFGLAADKTMYEPSEPMFASLRAKAEHKWVPEMQAAVGVDDTALPLLWDADFLFGPMTDAGEDSYVLCEINVSAVAPFPPSAVPKLVAATAAALRSRA